MKNQCEHDDCEKEATYEDYCDEHHEYHFCECGQRLGEYEGEGFCPRCR